MNVKIVKSQIKLSCATCCTGDYLSNQMTIVAISCVNVHLLPEHCHEGRPLGSCLRKADPCRPELPRVRAAEMCS